MESPKVKMGVPMTTASQSGFGKCWTLPSKFWAPTGPLVLELYSALPHERCRGAQCPHLEKAVGVTWQDGEEDEGAQAALHPSLSSVSP